MSLVSYDFSQPALRQLAEILRQSNAEFGPSARSKYEALIYQAIEDLVADPSRFGTQTVDGRIHYHLRHSRTRVPANEGRVGRPRHILITRIVGDRLRILALAYDAMEEALARRIEEGEGG